MTGEDMVLVECKDFTSTQIVRIEALMHQIYDCEGDIVGPHWCDECKDRWAKIWGLIHKFKKRNDAERQYAIKTLGLIGNLQMRCDEKLGD